LKYNIPAGPRYCIGTAFTKPPPPGGRRSGSYPRSFGRARTQKGRGTKSLIHSWVRVLTLTHHMGEEEEALSGLDQRERKRTATVRWFLLREIGFSVHAMVRWSNCDGPTAMLLPSRFELFCSYNCDGSTATLLPSQGNK